MFRPYSVDESIPNAMMIEKDVEIGSCPFETANRVPGVHILCDDKSQSGVYRKPMHCKTP